MPVERESRRLTALNAAPVITEGATGSTMLSAHPDAPALRRARATLSRPRHHGAPQLGPGSTPEHRQRKYGQAFRAPVV
jgi:hypothetical protein